MAVASLEILSNSISTDHPVLDTKQPKLLKAPLNKQATNKLRGFYRFFLSLSRRMWDNNVDATVTTLRAGLPRYCGSIPGRGQRPLPSPVSTPVLIRTECPSQSHRRDLSPRLKRTERKADHI
jgi:hypothetical protein